MSVYYSFYLGKRNAENKVEVIAPYVYKDGEMKLTSLLERSSSFIDGDELGDLMCFLPLDELAEKDKKHFSYTGWSMNSEPQSCAYACDYKDMVAAASKKGLRQGYVLLEDFSTVLKNNYQLNEYEVYMHSAEEYAEMQESERAKYGKIAYLAIDSIDYIASLLVELTECMVDYNFKKGEYVFLCSKC